MIKPDLHIVTFAVPYPARYGGAIDVYNRLKALHQEGLKIALHCFVYRDFNPHDALNEVVLKVHYYPRINWPALLAPGTPYIVSSRRNPVLLKCLKEDDVPVLFEGIHTTGFLDELKGRKRLLRAHNIEHKYYGHLARDGQGFQYLFFQRESMALESYECRYATDFDKVFTISISDQDWYLQHKADCTFLPAFHGFSKCNIREGRGDYLLYQGDLSIDSNQRALLDILSNIPEHFPFVVAGRKGDASFEEKLTKYTNLRREADVSEDKMLDLLRDAQAVIIRSRHSSGMKLKIFPALYNSRFVLSDENSLTHSGLDNALHVYKDPKDIPSLLEKLWNDAFTSQMLSEREACLQCLPSDSEKAKEIIRYL